MHFSIIEKKTNYQFTLKVNNYILSKTTIFFYILSHYLFQICFIISVSGPSKPRTFLKQCLLNLVKKSNTNFSPSILLLYPTQDVIKTVCIR